MTFTPRPPVSSTATRAKVVVNDALRSVGAVYFGLVLVAALVLALSWALSDRTRAMLRFADVTTRRDRLRVFLPTATITFLGVAIGLADAASSAASSPVTAVLARAGVRSSDRLIVQHRDYVLNNHGGLPANLVDGFVRSSGSKHHLADPALAVRLLGVDRGALLDTPAAGSPRARDATLLGQLFESLVTLDVRVYAQAAEAKVGHLRTQGGEHEIDLIVQRRDHRVVALEVKLSQTVGSSDVRHLLWLRDRMGDDLLDAAVITTGSEAYRRQDGIAVIPAALLGP